MTTDGNVVRVAAVGDIHCARDSQGKLQPLFTQVAERADVLLLCGDLTDYGLAEEAEILVKELQPISRIPILGVLGNHDFEAGQHKAVWDILCKAGVKMLDGDSFEVDGVGFVGICGFGGGFGRGTLGYWGEPQVKQFVQAAIDEALKLESALARLRAKQRIAVLHYAPIQATVEGEPPEIFPFLGTSRLEEPFLRYPVEYIVHGHAHHGTAEGKTVNGIPVYNVSMSLMERTSADHLPFRMLELPRA